MYTSCMMGEWTQQEAAAISFIVVMWSSLKTWSVESARTHTPYTSRKSEMIKSHSSQRKQTAATFLQETQLYWPNVKQLSCRCFIVQRMKSPLFVRQQCLSVVFKFMFCWRKHSETTTLPPGISSHADTNQTYCGVSNMHTNVKIRKLHNCSLLIVYVILITHVWTW